MPSNPTQNPADSSASQFLRVHIADADYLLLSQYSVAIEQRENLLPEASHPHIVAWRAVRAERWPVFHLGSDLCTRAHGDWEKAVFIDAKPHPIGFTASDILLLPSDVQVQPFTPPGIPPTPGGHIFSSAWVQGGDVMLAFNAPGFVAHLKLLGGL